MSFYVGSHNILNGDSHKPLGVVDRLEPVPVIVNIELNRNRTHAAIVGHGYTPTSGFIFNRVIRADRESGKDELVWQTTNPNEYVHEVNFTDKANENLLYLKLVNGDVKKMIRNDGVWSEAEQLTININCEASSEEHQYTVAHILGESKCRVYTPRHFYPIKRVVCQDPTSESEKTIWETEHPREFSKNVSVLSVTKTKNGYPDKYLCILQENNNYLLFLRDNELNNWVDITKTRVKLSKFQFFYNFKKLTPEEYEVKYEFLRFKILFKFGCNKVKYDGKKLIRKYIAGLEIDLSDSSIAFCDHSITLIMKTIVKHPDNLPGDLPENDEDADESGLKTQVISIK